MKKTMKFLPFAVIVPTLLAVALTGKVNNMVSAAESIYTRSDLPTTINLNDYEDAEIRNYYASLNSKADSERQGENLLKNLKTILKQDQKYYNYDYGNSIWQMYEITDRDWSLSPASAITNGTYDPTTNIITNYVYGKSNSNYDEAANPYLKSYYMDYSQPNQVKAWGNHDQDGYGINREHLWAKSEGFDDDSSGSGARGDPMHLVAANGCVNREHNNNYYGYVDKSATSTYDCKVKFFDSVGHNYVGPSKTHPLDGVKVFEPQDEDKGDIARAIFYMVARYNNIAGDDSTIGGANPNLALTNDLSTWASKGYTSTPTTCGYMGVLDDLLEWNELDPVDEYEIHRNNLLHRNFTNNRNPFIDFPQWANIIWGTPGTKIANPSSDKMNGVDPNTISNFTATDINYTNLSSLAPSATAVVGDVTFTYSRNEKGPFTSTTPVDSGIWYVKATSISNDEYKSQSEVKSFRIIGTPNEISDFTAPDIDTGKTPSPSATALSGDVTFTYSSSESGPFTDEVPTKAGTYYVKATSVNAGEYETTSLVKSFKINQKIFGLDPMTFYIIAGSVAVVVLIIILVIYFKGNKKTKKKIKKEGKKVAKSLGIPVPKIPSTPSSSSSSAPKKSTSSSTAKKSSSSTTSTAKKTSSSSSSSAKKTTSSKSATSSSKTSSSSKSTTSKSSTSKKK